MNPRLHDLLIHRRDRFATGNLTDELALAVRHPMGQDCLWISPSISFFA